jgi:hypothetical protein
MAAAWMAGVALCAGERLAGQAIDSATSYQAPVYPCADTTPGSLIGPDSIAGAREQLRAYDDWLLAKRFAPILRFAPGERYFPTLPFFTAFDPDSFVVARLSDSTQERYRAWVRPPIESNLKYLSPQGVPPPDTLLLRPQQLVSLSFLRDRYLERLSQAAQGSPHEVKPPHPVVLYRVCDLADRGASPDGKHGWGGQARVLWSYLRSDPQSWDRFGLDTLSAVVDGRPVLLKTVDEFRVVQYYFYYMADWGLQGHAEDIEFVFVFVPRNAAIARRFRIVVGAGHDPPAPNNVMVFLGPEADRTKHLNQNVLVELGGHSSAPDLPPFGQFSAGLDVNWHIDDVWGTRDEQASGGISFAGRYEGVMTYPRDPQDAVTLFPRPDGSNPETREMLRELVRIALDTLARRIRTAVNQPAESTSSRMPLADSVVKAYVRAARRQEAKTLEYLQRQVQVEYRAPAVDPGRWLTNLRHREQSRAVAAVLGDSARRCDSLCDQRAERLTLALDEASLYLPSDELTPHAAQWLDSALGQDSSGRAAAPEQQPRVGERVAAEVQAAVDERIKPEYSLLALDHLHALVRSATQGDQHRVGQYLALITRILYPSDCNEFCRAPNLDGKEAIREFRRTVCKERRPEGLRTAHDTNWVPSLACQFDTLAPHAIERVMELIAGWDQDLWDSRWPDSLKAERLAVNRHEIWRRPIYANPRDIFRTGLFRPTSLQVSNSRRAFRRLFPVSVTLFPGHAVMPGINIIVPAFHTFGVPMHIPGYLEIQGGVYWPWSGDSTRWKPALGLMYDRRFTYFWGWYVKGLYVFHRREAEFPSQGSDFTISAGPSLWVPQLFGMKFFRLLHFRPGLRFDTQWVRPTFRNISWDFQLELRH